MYISAQGKNEQQETSYFPKNPYPVDYCYLPGIVPPSLPFRALELVGGVDFCFRIYRKLCNQPKTTDDAPSRSDGGADPFPVAQGRQALG